MTIASYVYLDEPEWRERLALAETLARPCRLCPRQCGIDRMHGAHGFCGASDRMVISSIFPHHGEEPFISGTGGSGTVFFSYCTLKCFYCQNYQISHEAGGGPYDPESLADALLDLQSQGCHNVNLVTASHFLPRVLETIRIAAGKGLTIPLVYNCGGYESPETLAALKGVIDIYLPDMKYAVDALAIRYSRAPDYVTMNRRAIRDMFRQTGPLKCDSDGIARRGLCIRHLVLPNAVENSLAVCRFLAETFDPADLTISLMAQYRPLYRAAEFGEINRVLHPDEYETALTAFVDAGFTVLPQEFDRLDGSFCIDFTTKDASPLTGI
jgi:putative pyruvate formate lyase activating enzyme